MTDVRGGSDSSRSRSSVITQNKLVMMCSFHLLSRESGCRQWSYCLYFESSDLADYWVRLVDMKCLLLMGLAMVVSTCGSNGPSFISMSAVELNAYNRERPPGKHIFCVEERDTSTFIRKRICRSYEDWMAHNERAAMTLEVLNSRPSYSLPNSIQEWFFRYCLKGDWKGNWWANKGSNPRQIDYETATIIR